MATVPVTIRGTSQKSQITTLFRFLTIGLVLLLQISISKPVYAEIDDLNVNYVSGDIVLNPVKFTWTWNYPAGTIKLAINDKNRDNPIDYSDTKQIIEIDTQQGENSYQTYLAPGYYGAAIYNTRGTKLSNVVKFNVPTCIYAFSPDPANPNQTVTVSITSQGVVGENAIYSASISEVGSNNSLIKIISTGSTDAKSNGTSYINLTAPDSPAPSGSKYLVAAIYYENLLNKDKWFQCAIKSGDTVLTVNSPTPTPTSSPTPTAALPTIIPPPITQGPRVASICTLNDYFRSVVQILTVIGGFAFFIMTVVGGYRYLTSGGNPQTTAAARNIITFAVIGLILMILAWIILIFVQTLRGGGTPDLRIFNVCPFQ